MSLLDHDERELRPERELTLSTGSILGIFFGLVLLCGLFFGFGYGVGARKSIPVPAVAEAAPVVTPPANFSGFKPAAGSPAGIGTVPPSSGSATATGPRNGSPLPANPSHPVSSTDAAANSSAEATTSPVKNPPSIPRSTQTSAPSVYPPAAPGSFMVQVAAVSHQEDAELLVGALKGKGYAVAAHSEPQDKLLHIQVGPFSNRKDADAMRQRLLADGYNALVK